MALQKKRLLVIGYMLLAVAGCVIIIYHYHSILATLLSLRRLPYTCRHFHEYIWRLIMTHYAISLLLPLLLSSLHYITLLHNITWLSFTTIVCITHYYHHHHIIIYTLVVVIIVSHINNNISSLSIIIICCIAFHTLILFCLHWHNITLSLEYQLFISFHHSLSRFSLIITHY